MTLNFPNHSRSYDDTTRRVRFTGYDGMFEIQFFIEIEALESRMKHLVHTEAGYLKAFDQVRDDIIYAARKTYTRGGNKPFVLTAASF